MPTQQTTYNSRITDEALEKRFRDTFRSQGGAELVDDLYAQGVIVPIVDFTAAATGGQLSQNLQTAWDFVTGSEETTGGTSTIITTAGFWKVEATASLYNASAATRSVNIDLSDGLSTRTIWKSTLGASGGINDIEVMTTWYGVIFVRSGDSVSVTAGSAAYINVSYRQIATVSGDLINPSGFTSS